MELRSGEHDGGLCQHWAFPFVTSSAKEVHECVVQSHDVCSFHDARQSNPATSASDAATHAEAAARAAALGAVEATRAGAHAPGAEYAGSGPTGAEHAGSLLGRIATASKEWNVEEPSVSLLPDWGGTPSVSQWAIYWTAAVSETELMD